LNRFERFLADRPLKINIESLAILKKESPAVRNRAKSEQIEQIKKSFLIDFE
jgi:hypothetical protein